MGTSRVMKLGRARETGLPLLAFGRDSKAGRVVEKVYCEKEKRSLQVHIDWRLSAWGSWQQAN